MSRRRRRNVKTKETLPPKAQILNRKLRSTKHTRKKTTVLKSPTKNKTNVKKSKTLKPPDKISESSEKILIKVEPPDIEDAKEHNFLTKETIVPENEESTEIEEGEGTLVIDEKVEDENSVPSDQENEGHDSTAPELDIPTVNESHSEAESPVKSSEENMMTDTNKPTAQNICTVCNIVVDSSASLTNHMKQHSITINQTHQCLICSKSLSSASSLDRHMLVHSGERPFKCKLCDMSFTTNGNMHRHMRTHSEIDTLENGKSVDLRKEPVASESVDDPDISVKIPEAKLHCPVCGKGFLCQYGLQSHMDTHPNDPIMCQKCDTISANYTAHIEHKCDMLGSKSPIKCHHSLQCGFHDLNFMDFTSNKFSLVSKSHCEQNIKRPSSAFHAFECRECKKAFPCGRALKLHQNVHETKTGTFCPSCQCDFAAASFLQLHQLKHRSAEHCLKNSFNNNAIPSIPQSHALRAGKEDFLALLNLQTKQSQLSILNSLKSTHVKEDDFENYDYFVHGKVMKKDIKTEEIEGNNNNNNDFADIQSIISLTSKAPLISAAQTSPIAVRPTSPLSFASRLPKSPPTAESANASPDTPSNENAVNHQLPKVESFIESRGIYSCKICSQKFKKISALKRHSKLHVQRGSNYSCHICSYVSVDKSTIIRHLRTHNGERPFQCVICKYAFTTKANCERHVRKRHKKFGKSEIRNSMQYNPNMSHRGSIDTSTADISNSETVCKYCGVDFKFNRVLRHHLRSLHNSCNRKPFSCKICNFGFSTKNNCIRHVLKQHPNLKDKLRSVVIPNSQMQQMVNAELTSSNNSDNSNSSIPKQTVTEENQPLDLHCNNDKPLDLQIDKTPADYNANEAVMAAEGLVSLSAAPPLQEEPLDLAAHAIDLSCKPLSATIKKPDVKPSTICNAPPGTYKPVGFIDLSTAKTIPLSEKNIQISPLPMNNCAKKAESVNKTDVTSSNTPGQKQRSFTCVYCSAGFTLKSNMERHIKRKHPEYARPTRSRNFIPSIVTPAVQKQNSATLSDKTRDALRHVLSTKVQQVPVYKSFNHDSFPKFGGTFKIVGSAHSFLTPVKHVPNSNSLQKFSLDLSGKNEKIAIVDLNVNSIKLSENGNDEDLASVSSVICTANSPQFKQYLEKSTDIEKMEEEVTQSPEKSLDNSNAKKTDTPSVSCPFCDRKFPWRSSLRRHILTHTGQKPYKCPKCSLWFTTKSNCERHLIRKHGHKGDLITRSVPDRPYKCNHCLTSTFSTQGNLRKHFYLKHWTKSYLGMNCKPNLADKTAEQSPTKLDSENSKTTSTPVKVSETVIPSATTQEHSYSQLEKKLAFACNFCDKSFDSITDLSSHMSKHKSVIYMCYLCRKTFPNQDDCHNHFKTSHSLVYMRINPVENKSKKSSNEENAEEIPDTPVEDHKGPSIACMICFEKMSCVESLQIHFKRHLTKDKLSENKEHKCPEKADLPTKEASASSPKTVSVNTLTDSKKPRLAKGKNSLLYLFTQSPTDSSGKSTRHSNTKLELVSPEEDSDLIQNLLGIHDSKIIDEMLVSADSAARLLGVKEM